MQVDAGLSIRPESTSAFDATVGCHCGPELRQYDGRLLPYSLALELLKLLFPLLTEDSAPGDYSGTGFRISAEATLGRHWQSYR